jgi:hypothetical protein
LGTVAGALFVFFSLLVTLFAVDVFLEALALVVEHSVRACEAGASVLVEDRVTRLLDCGAVAGSVVLGLLPTELASMFFAMSFSEKIPRPNVC